MADPNPSVVSNPGLSDNAAGGIAYITFIPAILFLAMAPYNRSLFVRFHAWQSIFLTIAYLAVDVVLIILGHMPVLGLATLFIWPLVGLGFFVVWIILLIKAFGGSYFKLPILGDLAEKQAHS